MSNTTLLSVKRLKSSPPRYLNPLNDHYIQSVWFLRIKVYGITRSNIQDDPTRSKLMGAAKYLNSSNLMFDEECGLSMHTFTIDF